MKSEITNPKHQASSNIKNSKPFSLFEFWYCLEIRIYGNVSKRCYNLKPDREDKMPERSREIERNDIPLAQTALKGGKILFQR